MTMEQIKQLERDVEYYKGYARELQDEKYKLQKDLGEAQEVVKRQRELIQTLQLAINALAKKEI